MLRAADTDVRHLADTDLFGNHLPENAVAGEAIGAFGVLRPPPVAHLKALSRQFALEVCCKWYAGAVEDIAGAGAFLAGPDAALRHGLQSTIKRKTAAAAGATTARRDS